MSQGIRQALTLTRVVLALFAGGLMAMAFAPAALANHSVTELVSAGPNGGNGSEAATFVGASSDGSRVFFETREALVSGDVDGDALDVYERFGSNTILISTGPEGLGLDASFVAASSDGTHVFFRTSDPLVASDGDGSQDIYERFGGNTTLLSTGPSGGNGPYPVTFGGLSDDATRVFFTTAEQLTATDTDNASDLYGRSASTTALISTPALFGGLYGDARFNDSYPADGSSVLFDTRESLVSEDTDSNRSDVYMNNSSGTTLVSTGPNDTHTCCPAGATPAKASNDGAHIFFTTGASLVGFDSDGAIDVYERSGSSTSIKSIGPTGGNAGGMDASLAGISSDGTRVYFGTYEGLVAADGGGHDIYQRTGTNTTLVTGPYDCCNPAYFSGASEDGSRVFYVTNRRQTADDLDSGGWQDVYERSGGTTSLVSVGGNGSNHAFYDGISQDGSRVFFHTAESLVPTDTDTQFDIYERFGGVTTLISTGPQGGNGDFSVCGDPSLPCGLGVSQDGKRLFFNTSEVLVGADGDSSQDVYSSSVAGTSSTTGYPRPQSAQPLRMPFVVAYKPCAGPNNSHAGPVAVPSCNPPVQVSDYLTVGTPDANGQPAKSNGYLLLRPVGESPINPNNGDQSDIQIQFSITDVRNKSDLSDYTGELRFTTGLRITDKYNGASQTDPATTADLPLSITSTCIGNGDATVGSTCSVTTTADALNLGITEAKRAIFKVGEFQVYDGGPDGDVDTANNTIFGWGGVFVP